MFIFLDQSGLCSRHWEKPLISFQVRGLRACRASCTINQLLLVIPPWPEFGVYAELPAPGAITFVFGPGSTPDHGQVLITALRHIGRWVFTLKFICVRFIAVGGCVIYVHDTNLVICFDMWRPFFKIVGSLVQRTDELPQDAYPRSFQWKQAYFRILPPHSQEGIKPEIASLGYWHNAEVNTTPGRNGNSPEADMYSTVRKDTAHTLENVAIKALSQIETR